MSIDATQWLNKLRDTDTESFLVFQNIIDAVNGGFKQLGVDPTGKVSAPAPPEALNVTANNGTVQAVITHNAPVSKQSQYFIEADTNPAFPQPHVFHLGASRTLFTSLPNKDGGGNNQSWHFRAYVQDNGSDASTPTYFGSQVVPTAVTVGGNSSFTPIPSTGSGTASPTGEQGAYGLGRVLTRPAP